ncbi:MAG TPA: hypothetical protein VFU36_02045 [Jatrophihabitans sp.]|nr:hypothetical protein [Jatrophihabitans sp.]
MTPDETRCPAAAGYQEDAMTGVRRPMSLTGDRPRAGRLVAALPQRRPLIRLVLAQQLTGIALGLIWVSWSPRSVSYLLDSGNGVGVVLPAQSETQIAADGRYAVLTVLAGLVFGLLSWRVRRNRGPVALVVLTVSSLLGSLLALATGQLLSNGQHAKELNTAFHPGLVLHGTAEVFLQALFATLVYTVFVGLTGDRELGRGETGRFAGVPDRPSEEVRQPSEEVRQPDGKPPQPDGEPRQPDGELRSGG